MKSTMVPFINQSDLVLDNDQNIIPGAKIEVFDPVSNNHVNIYTYDSVNDQYVIAQNPIYLDNQSRAQQTYFSDRLVLCMLYKYIGSFSDPMTDDDTENWRYVRDWLSSFNTNVTDNDAMVTGLSGLKAADTDLGSVSVVGYWTGDDCEARSYVWNPTSVATPDNGYIVKSDDSDTGRWILQFDGEYLPSTYYGVYPGREANMNALLTFPAAIGSQLTAPGVYFRRGTYNDATTALTTNKKVLVDADTEFTRTSFTVSDIKVIGHSTHGVCDWVIYDPDHYTSSQLVHSSWFRTAEGFWKSKARTLVIDQYNHFTSSVINNPVTIYQQNIIGNSYINATYAGEGRISINQCNIVGQQIFRVNYDNLTFFNTEIKQEWFTVSSTSDYTGLGTRLICSSDTNTINLCNFKNNAVGSDFYRAIMAHRGSNTLDLDGRIIGTFTNTFTNLKNVTVGSGNSIHIDGSIGTVNLSNVRGGYVTVDGSNITLNITDGSVINLINPDNVLTLNVTDSTVGSASVGLQANNIDTFKTSINALRSTITANLVQSSASSTSWGKDLKLIETTLNRTDGTHQLSGKIWMKNCSIQQPVVIYPFKDNSNNYWFFSEFQECIFSGSGAVRYELYDPTNMSTTVHHIKPHIKFDGNSFNGTDPYGIRMPMWTSNDQTGNYPFLSTLYSDYNCYYKGNSGTCPREWETYFSMANMDSISDFDQVPSGYVSKIGNRSRVWYLNAMGTTYIGSLMAEVYGIGKAFSIGSAAPGIATELKEISVKLVNSTAAENQYGYGKTLSPAAYDLLGDQFDIRMFISTSDWSSGDYVSLVPMGDFSYTKPAIR